MRQTLFILLLGLGSFLASCDGAPPTGGQVEAPNEEDPGALGGAEQEPLPNTPPEAESNNNSITPQSAPAVPDDSFQGGSSDSVAQPGEAAPFEGDDTVEPQTTEELPLITEPDPSRETAE